MESKILFGNDARAALFGGVRELSDAVTTTLGPMGHTVVINRGYNLPYMTKDGVTVARAYETEDVVKGMGAMLIKMAAAKTCDEAGDGTTTTVLLARKMIENGIDFLANSDEVNIREFRRGMEDALAVALARLKDLAVKVPEGDYETLRKIALISSNGDEEVADMITNAIGAVGRDGVITVEDAAGKSDMSVAVTSGFHWSKGLLSHHFVTDPERIECALDSPYVLILSNRINYYQELAAVVQTVYTEHRPLLIVAPDISPDAMKFLTLNVQKGTLKAAFVKAPGYGQIQMELIEDLACHVGATVVESGDNAAPMHFGTCSRAIVSATQTIIVSGGGDSARIEERIQGIRHQLEEATNAFDKDKLRERIAYLSGGTAVIYVGADSEVELKERKDRVDDAVNAVKSALEEGYVTGCGVAAAQLADVVTKRVVTPNQNNDSYMAGANCVTAALNSIYCRILENSGMESDKGLIPVNEIEWGIDSETGTYQYGLSPVTGLWMNMLESGVIDPAKVLRCALVNAASIAGQFLNTDSVIATPTEK